MIYFAVAKPLGIARSLIRGTRPSGAKRLSSYQAPIPTKSYRRRATELVKPRRNLVRHSPADTAKMPAPEHETAPRRRCTRRTTPRLPAVSPPTDAARPQATYRSHPRRHDATSKCRAVHRLGFRVFRVSLAMPVQDAPPLV